jgi:hypothetical protein
MSQQRRGFFEGIYEYFSTFAAKIVNNPLLVPVIKRLNDLFIPEHCLTVCTLIFRRAVVRSTSVISWQNKKTIRFIANRHSDRRKKHNASTTLSTFKRLRKLGRKSCPIIWEWPPDSMVYIARKKANKINSRQTNREETE